MFEWSDDDEVLVAPPPSTKAPSRNTRAEEQSRGGEEVPQKQATGVPEQQAKGVPEQQARRVPERRAEGVPEQQARGALELWAEERPMAETAGPPPQDVGVDPKAAAGGSGRQRRFRKIYRKATT